LGFSYLYGKLRKYGLVAKNGVIQTKTHAQGTTNIRNYPDIIPLSGKRISDQNEKRHSAKICLELTKKRGLYIASGKENVKEHRLKEPDKTKYEIFHALQSAVAHSSDWAELIGNLKKQGISTQFKYKSGT
jgi:hypothetical protein